MSTAFVREKIDELPLIAILRGLTPAEAIGIGTALYDSGIRVMEVTLNSPDPLHSIRLLAAHFEGRMAVGAGTVLSVNDVDKVRAAGGRFIVSPNTNPSVISHTVGLGMFSVPGVATCTECFQAIDAGATALKIFPASVVGIRGVKDLMAVIPKEVDLFAVGGVGDTNLGEWLETGVKGVGLGSHLYSAGDTPGETSRKAGVMIARMKACRMS